MKTLEINKEYRTSGGAVAKMLAIYPGHPDRFVGCYTSIYNERKYIGVWAADGHFLGQGIDYEIDGLHRLNIKLPELVKWRDVPVGSTTIYDNGVNRTKVLKTGRSVGIYTHEGEIHLWSTSELVEYELVTDEDQKIKIDWGK